MDRSATFETVAGEAPLVRWPRVLHVVGATRPSCADPEWSEREVGVAPIQYGTAGSSGIRIYVDHSLMR